MILSLICVSGLNERGDENMTEGKVCGMCECTVAAQWIKKHGTYTCGACMQEMWDMAHLD